MCWDLSSILSAIGILASAASIYVALHIYNGWTKQKQKELAANCAEIIMEKMGSLRQDILKAHNEGKADEFLIDNMEITKGDIKYYQSKLRILGNNINENDENLAHENLSYERYINSLSKLILTLQADPNSISKKENTDDIIWDTKNLFYQLIDISLYIWK